MWGGRGWETLTTKKKLRVAALGALITGLLLPAGLAVGSHDDIVVDPDGGTSVVLLTLGKRDQVTWNGLTQGITTRNNDCLAVSFAPTPQLLVVSAIGGELGEVKDGLGVRGPNDGSGEPCGRVSAPDQAISVTLGQALEGHVMAAVDLDLELKFNAEVEATFLLGGHQVGLDVFNPSEGSDDGPDSKDGDNYRYFHRPMNNGQPVYFDQVVLRAAAGAFSLEGGADLASNDEPDAFGQLDPTSKSSQFEVVPAFDGEITCQDIVPISVGGVPVSASVIMHAMKVGDGAWDIGCTERKPYNAGVTFDSVLFVPELEGTTARYTMEVTLVDQEITGSAGQVTSLIALYDPEGNPDPTKPLLACLGEPVTDGDGYEAFWTQDDTGLLPSEDETACYYSVQLVITGEDVGTEIWGIYFEDDPVVTFK